MDDLVKWLRSLKGVSDVAAVSLHIDGVVYQATRYMQDGRERYYVVGSLPRAYRRRPNGTCFRFEGDQADWYIACYWQGGAPNQHHPFGDNFVLMKWQVPDGTAIDAGFGRPYSRRPIHFTDTL